jgi:hypothetical protein
MRTLRCGLVALALAAGCASSPDNGYAIDLTVVADKSVTDDALHAIRTLVVEVTGAETFEQSFPVASQFNGRHIKLLYRPSLTAVGTDHFAVYCVDENSQPLAFGERDISVQPRKTVSATLIVTSEVTNAFPDGGAGSDGGDDGGSAAPPRKQGETCTPGVDVCESGNCVDGFCCDTACGDACTACNVAGLEGTCSPVAAGGMPSHGSCPMFAADDLNNKCSTDGTCDGKGACHIWPAGTVCNKAHCDPATNVLTRASLCDNMGRCIPQGMYNCEPYLCNADSSACLDTCTDNNQCCNDMVNPARCENSGVNNCVNNKCGKLPQGRDCAQTTDCKDGLSCTDGVCCESACTGQCQSCKSNPADPTTVGKCLPVTGAPRTIANTTRPACTGTGACQGSCDGVNTGACAMPSGNVCRTASCALSNAVWTGNDQAKCNGTGTCPPSVYNCQDRAPLGTVANGCNGAACTYTCQAGKADCDANGTCETDITTDAHCGSCGNACNTGNTGTASASNPFYSKCISGTCQCDSSQGWVLCSTAQAPGGPVAPQCYKPSGVNCCRPGTPANPEGCNCKQVASSCGKTCCVGAICRCCLSSYTYRCTSCDPSSEPVFLDTRYPCGTEKCVAPVGGGTPYTEWDGCLLGP